MTRTRGGQTHTVDVCLQEAPPSNLATGRTERAVILGDLSSGKIVSLALVGLFVFGPDRLPRVAKDLGRTPTAGP